MTMELNGKHIILMLILFFGAIIGVNTMFIVQSIETFRGEDQHDPYLQGIDFNRTLDERAEQAALGWNATLEAVRGAGGAVTVEITLHDKKGAALDGLALTGELRHPTDSERDRLLVLRNAGKGTYVATLGHVSPGMWDIIVQSAKPKAVPFEASRRIWLR
jgi:nitrogen fixation protein FixH